MTVFEHQIFEKFYDFNLQPISIMSTLHAANYAEQSMNCTFDVKMYMHNTLSNIIMKSFFHYILSNFCS